MRRLLLGVTVALIAATLAAPAQAGSSQQATSSSPAANSASSSPAEYVVLYANGASADSAHAAIEAAGGTVVRENGAVGLATVRTTNADFLSAVSGQRALFSAMPNHAIGQIPNGNGQGKRDSVESDRSFAPTAEAAAKAAAAASSGASSSPTSEPLADKQWDMRQIDATPNGSYRINQGKSGVMVGIIDTGIDGSHPTSSRTSTAS
jgi:hypothetical protein